MSRTKLTEVEEEALAEQKEVKQRRPLLEACKRFHVKLTFTTPILGSAPASKELYAKYVASLQPEPTPENIAAETALVPEDGSLGRTVFRVDPESKHLLFLAHQVRGFLKEAASAITGKALTAYKSKIDKFLYVSPDKIPLMRDGAAVTKYDCLCERPLKAMTAMGPRVSLLSSEQLEPGIEIEFDILVLPNGQKELTEDLIKSWFEYGQFHGISQWANGSYGRFDFEMTAAG